MKVIADKNKRITIIILLLILCAFSAQTVLAQGFTKLKDKYGTPTTPPVQNTVDTTSANQPSSADNTNTDTTNPIQEDDDEDGMFLNGEYEIKDLIKSISALTKKGFIIDEKLRGKIAIFSEKKMSTEMAYQAFLSALEVNGYTITETPSGLLNVVPQKESHSKSIDLITGNAPITDKFVTVIVSLKSISANEVVQVVKGLEMKSKNGQLYSYPTTNSIIITDTGTNIDRITRLIKELDQQGPQQIIEMVPIVNADAKDIADKINQLFSDASSSAQSPNVVRSRIIGRPGNAAQEIQDVPSLSKVIADERTNSVILMGRKRDLIKVKATIARLDRPIQGVEGSIHVHRLSYANAKEIAQTLEGLVADSKTKSAATTTSNQNTRRPAVNANAASQVTGAVALEGGVKISADEASNSLVIVASPKDYAILVEQVISKLDIMRPQVSIEALVMSLDVTKSTSLGVNLLGGLTNLADKGLNLFGSVLPTATNSLSTIAGLSGGFAGGILSDKTIDFTLSDGSTISVPAVSGIIQAIAADTNTTVLSKPSLMVVDNEEATIQVGQEVPVPAGTNLSTGGVTTFEVTREDTGIILKIKPQISDEGNSVRLKITQEISAVIGAVDPSLGPTLDKKSVDTTVTAQDKQTIVIGGLMDDQESVANTKVPLLGDIPVLGSLFRTRSKSQQKRNLVIFITPYIIREREDYLAISKKAIEERNAFIDANLGLTQRKKVRAAIKRHAEELLEFSCDFPDNRSPCTYQKEPPVKEDTKEKRRRSKK